MRTISVLALLAIACSNPAQDNKNHNPKPNGHKINGGNGGGDGGGGDAPLIATIECSKGTGTTYEVGEGKKYTSIGAVPLEKLGGGDTVLIHYRAEPYREKVLLSASGEKGKPITLCGVPGPKGELPIISGDNATTRKESVYPYEPTADRGLVIMTPKPGDRWGYKPSWIVLQNLVLRSAYPGTDAKNPLGFTDNKGAKRAYAENAASVFVERGEHITVRNCVITDSGNGLFVASANTEEVLSKDILVEGSYIYGNGIVGVERRHNVYTEAAGVVFQGNRFGPQRAGAGGNQIKDRSAGTIIRYNWIEGGAHLLDLVEPEEALPMLGPDPRFHQTFVYGNVLISGPTDGSSLIHYGGDNGATDTYRKGTLYFFHNTVVIRADEDPRWHTTMFRVETDDETVDARNNVIWKEGSTHLTLMKEAGKLVLGTNWVSKGYEPWQYPDQKVAGSIKGIDSLIIGSDPAFADADANDFRMSDESPALGAGGPLPGVPAEHLAKHQDLVYQAVVARKALGAGASLGAFER